MILIRSVSFAFLAAALGAAATGCSRRADDRAAPAASYPRPEDALVVATIAPARPGGTIVVGALAEPKSFNPLVGLETSSTEVTYRIFDNLVELDCASSEYRPGLAKSWDLSPDGRRWTFHLRRGVAWADGAPFTADDVLFTFRAIYDSSTASPDRGDLTSGGAPFRVTKEDDHTIVIETADTFGPMLHVLATSAEIVPRHVWEPALAEGRMAEALGIDTPPEKVFGTGPYRLEKRETGRAILVRNARYWKFDRDGTRLPYLDRVVFVSAGDSNGWRLKFDAGEVDYYLVRPEEIDEMRARGGEGGFQVVDLGPRLGTIHFWLNQNPGRDEKGIPFVDPRKSSWFRDIRFRRAVSLAIDRDAIVQTVYRGYAVPIHGPISPGDPRWYNAALPAQPRDPERSRALLSEIGFRDRNGDGFLEDHDGAAVAFTFLAYGGNPVWLNIGHLIESDLAAVGVRATLAPIDFNTLVTTIHETYRYEGCLGSIASSGDPASGTNVWLSGGTSHEFHPRQASPATAWEREVDSLVAAHLATADYPERKRLFDRIQVLFAENLGFIYLANDEIHLAIRDRFVNLRPGRFRAFHHVLWNEDEIALREAR